MSSRPKVSSPGACSNGGKAKAPVRPGLVKAQGVVAQQKILLRQRLHPAPRQHRRIEIGTEGKVDNRLCPARQQSPGGCLHHERDTVPKGQAEPP